MRRKSRSSQGDIKNFVIFVLSVIVLVESFLLYTQQQEKIVRKSIKRKPTTIQSVLKREVPPIKQEPLLPREPLKKPVIGRIAIIIDDWGYNSTHCVALSEIKNPVTVAVLPNLAHSRDIAICAHDQNKEVMLHLPLEPHKNLDRYPENYIIKTSLHKSKIEAMFKDALASVPFVDGVNNHMGSKATENKRLMAIIFALLKQERLFFVDSFVTSDSICRPLAQEMNIPFTQRDIFLDNENTRSYIENQFALLAKEARKKGYAVGIGHDRELTLEIIKEQTDQLAEQGFQIVTVRNLIEGN